MNIYGKNPSADLPSLDELVDRLLRETGERQSSLVPDTTTMLRASAALDENRRTVALERIAAALEERRPDTRRADDRKLEQLKLEMVEAVLDADGPLASLCNRVAGLEQHIAKLADQGMVRTDQMLRMAALLERAEARNVEEQQNLAAELDALARDIDEGRADLSEVSSRVSALSLLMGRAIK